MIAYTKTDFMTMHRRGQRKQRGQGLIEYTMVLALIALLVLGAFALYGDKLGDTWCRLAVILSAVSDSPPPASCTKPVITWRIGPAPPGQLNLEAMVLDPDKPANMTLSDDIDVSFLRNDMFLQRDEAERFCLGGGSSPTDEPIASPPCRSSVAVVPGDVIKAIATDVNGNTSELTYLVP